MSGREKYWDVEEFTSGLEMYLEQSGDVSFEPFRDSFSGKIPNEDIDLISYLNKISQNTWEPSLKFLFELTLSYMMREKPELFKK